MNPAWLPLAARGKFTQPRARILADPCVDNCRVVLMVDLSEPNSLWFTLESLMGALNSHLQHSIKVQLLDGPYEIT